MSWPHDPELPAGYQSADIEQAELERQGRRSAELRRRGVCTHGSRQAVDSCAGSITADAWSAMRSRCCECGRVATNGELDAEARELLG
jgi:hypothetical protein